MDACIYTLIQTLPSPSLNLTDVGWKELFEEKNAEIQKWINSLLPLAEGRTYDIRNEKPNGIIVAITATPKDVVNGQV